MKELSLLVFSVKYLKSLTCIDPSKIQIPCAHCKSLLNVPHGLDRFVCPQCKVELAVELLCPPSRKEELKMVTSVWDESNA